MNLVAIEDMNRKFPHVELCFVESGGLLTAVLILGSEVRIVGALCSSAFIPTIARLCSRSRCKCFGFFWHSTQWKTSTVRCAKSVRNFC